MKNQLGETDNAASTFGPRANRQTGSEDAISPQIAMKLLSDAGGVEIDDIDLRQPLSVALKHTILKAFLDHHIVLFRNQALTKDQQYAFTLNFGEIEEHVGRMADGSRYPTVHSVSNLDKDGNPTDKLFARGNYFWHTDKSYHAVPSLMTMLHSVEIPPEGGDTQFANTAMAYAALSDGIKQQIAGLHAVHSWEAHRRNTGGVPPTEDEKRERPPVVHPVVRTHPDTKKKALYIGIHTSHIAELPEREGRALLDDLLEHATQPEFVYTHCWRRGDVILWDNRCLLHRALANYEMGKHKRVLYRTVVTGSVPF